TILDEDGEVGEHRRHSPSRARAQSVAFSCSTSGMWAAAYRSPAVATSDTVRIVAARPRMARSPPGHATPRPSPNQNAPKLPIRTPTENFSVFSGTAASGLRRASAATATATAAPAAPRLGNDQVTAATNREHDEDHFEPLQDHGLQGGHKPD